MNFLANAPPESSSGQESTLWASSQILQPASLGESPDLASDEDLFQNFDGRSFYDPQTKVYSEYAGCDEAVVQDTSTPESFYSMSSANLDPSKWPSSQFLQPVSLGTTPDLAVDEDPFSNFNAGSYYDPQTKVFSDFPGLDEERYVLDPSMTEQFYSISSANLDLPDWPSSQFLPPVSLGTTPDLTVDDDPFSNFNAGSYHNPHTKVHSDFPGLDEESYVLDTSTLESFNSMSSVNLGSSKWPSPQFLQQASLEGLPDLAEDEDALMNTSKSQNSTQWIPEDINQIGYQDEDKNWRCKYSGCISNKVFDRACDLRKHFRAHRKLFFCEQFDCPQYEMGFSSSKDLQRHRNSHNPQIQCEEFGCDRVFSRKGTSEIFFALIKYANDMTNQGIYSRQYGMPPGNILHAAK